MTEVCVICAETINHSTRKSITCSSSLCDFTACKTCIRTYILNSYNDPHCMSCKQPYDHEFMTNNLNQSFVNKDYKEQNQLSILKLAAFLLQ